MTAYRPRLFSRINLVAFGCDCTQSKVCTAYIVGSSIIEYSVGRLEVLRHRLSGHVVHQEKRKTVELDGWPPGARDDNFRTVNQRSEIFEPLIEDVQWLTTPSTSNFDAELVRYLNKVARCLFRAASIPMRCTSFLDVAKIDVGGVAGHSGSELY